MSGQGNIIFGKELFLSFDFGDGTYKLPCYSDEFTLDINANTINIANRHAGEWEDSIATTKSWSLGGFSNLYTVDEDKTHFISATELLNMVGRKIKVKGIFVEDSESIDGIIQKTNTQEFFGEIILPKISLSNKAGEPLKISADLKGCGKLTIQDYVKQ